MPLLVTHLWNPEQCNQWQYLSIRVFGGVYLLLKQLLQDQHFVTHLLTPDLVSVYLRNS